MSLLRSFLSWRFIAATNVPPLSIRSGRLTGLYSTMHSTSSHTLSSLCAFFVAVVTKNAGHKVHGGARRAQSYLAGSIFIDHQDISNTGHTMIQYCHLDKLLLLTYGLHRRKSSNHNSKDKRTNCVLFLRYLPLVKLCTT